MANNDFDPLLGAPPEVDAAAAPPPSTPPVDFSDPAVRAEALRGYLESDLWKQRGEASALRESRVAELRKLQEPPGAAMDWISRAGRGVAIGTGKALEGLARGVMDAGFASAPVDEQTARMLMQARQKPSAEREQAIRDTGVFKAGEWMEEAAKEYYRTDPKRDEKFLAQFAESLGHTSVSLGAGLLTRNPVAFMAIYAAQTGEQAAEDVIAAGKPENTDLAFLEAAGIGAATEIALGIPGKLIRMVRAARKAGIPPRQFGRSVRVAAMKFAKDTAENVVREGGQETLEQALLNKVQQQLGDENTPLSEGLWDSLVMGGFMGGVIGTPFQLAGQADYSRERKARYQKVLEQRKEIQQTRGQRDRADALGGFYDTEQADEQRAQEQQSLQVLSDIAAREAEAAWAYDAGEITQEQFMAVISQTTDADRAAMLQVAEPTEDVPPVTEPPTERPPDALEEQGAETIPPQPAPEAGEEVGGEVPSETVPPGTQVEEEVAPPTAEPPPAPETTLPVAEPTPQPPAAPTPAPAQEPVVVEEPPPVGTIVQATFEGQPLTLRYDGDMMGMQQYTVQGEGVGRYIKGGTFMRKTLEKQGVTFGGIAPAPTPAVVAPVEAPPPLPFRPEDVAQVAAEIKAAAPVQPLQLRKRFGITLKEAWVLFKQAKALSETPSVAPMPAPAPVEPEPIPIAGPGEVLTEPDLPAEFGANNTLFTKERLDEAFKRLRRKGGETQVPGFDIERLEAITEIVGFYVEGGIRAFPKVAKLSYDRVVEIVGTSAIRYIREAYRIVRSRPNFVATGMDDDNTIDRVLESDPAYRDALMPEAAVDEPPSVPQKAIIDSSKTRPKISLKTWLDMTVEEMKAHAVKEGVDVEQLAMRVGRHLIASEADLFDAIQTYRRLRLAGLSAVAVAGTRLPAAGKAKGADPYAQRTKYVNEAYARRVQEVNLIRKAIEAATASAEVGEALVKDATYDPKFNALDIDELRSEDVQTIKLRLLDPRPLPPAAPGMPQFSTVRSIRSQAIEQAITVNPQGAIQDILKWSEPPSQAELAYATSIIGQLRGKETPYIGNNMRNIARREAQKRGFVLSIPELRPEPPEPKILGTPPNTPTKDRMYRQVRTLANGVKTVSVEFNHPNFPEIQQGTIAIKTDQAAVRDHIIWTQHGRFKGFLGFRPGEDERKQQIYSLIQRNPSPEYVTKPELPVKYWGVPIPRGALAEIQRNRLRLIEHTTTTLTKNQLKHAVQAIDQLQPSDDAENLLDAFLHDIEHPGQNDSKFVRDMLQYIRPRTIFSAPYTLDGARYVNASVPGVVNEMRVAIGDTMNPDEIYRLFINTFADALSVYQVRIGIRSKMGIPTERVMGAPAPKPVKAKPEEITQGARVTVKHLGKRVKGIVKKVNKIMVPRVTETGVVQGIRGFRTSFDVQLEDVHDSKGKPVVKLNVPLPDVDATPIEVAIVPVLKKAIVLPEYTGRAKATLFDGEPFEQGMLLDVPLRDWHAAQKVPDDRRKMARVLRDKMTQKQLLDMLYDLGMEDAPQKIAAEELGFDKEKVNRYEQARRWARGNEIPFAYRTEWDENDKERYHGRLASLVVDRVAHLYDVVYNVEVANRRIKERTSNVLLGISDFNLSKPRYVSTLQSLVDEIKRNQEKPQDWDRKLSDKLKNDILPAADEGRTMLIRLANRRTWAGAKHQLSDVDRERSIRVSLGDILVRVIQSGMVKEKPKTELLTDSADSEVKKVTPVKQQAWLSVQEDGRALIQVYERGDYITIYWVDLKLLQQQNAAKPWENKAKISEGNERMIKGWYVNPKVLANSGRMPTAGNPQGVSRWNRANPDLQEFMSIEDYHDYIGERLARIDPSMITAPGTTAEATQSEIQAMPSTAEELFKGLEEAGEDGHRLIREMEDATGQAGEQAVWTGFSERAADILIGPEWRAQPKTDRPTQAKLTWIAEAVQAYQEKKAAQAGIASVTSSTPTTANTNPALLSKVVRGKQAIRTLLADAGNGLSPQARESAIAFVDALPEQVLEGLELVIEPGEALGVGNVHRLRYAGSYSHLHRLVQLIANSGSSTAAVEEIAHALAEFLPYDMRTEVERQRQAAIAQLETDNRDATQEFVAMLGSRGGAITSRQFMSLGRSDLIDFYPLINTDEFFAHNLTDASIKANQSSEMNRIVAWAKNWFHEVWLALRRMLGSLRAEREMFFDQLLKDFNDGKFAVSVRGGYLHEVNKDSDLASIIFARKPKDIAAYRAMLGQRTAEDVGDILAAEVFSFRELVSIIDTRLTAAGTVLSPRAKQLAGFTNVEAMLLEVQSLFGATFQDIQSAMAAASTPGLRNEIAQSAFALVKHYEGIHKRLTKTLESKQEYVESPEFARLIAQAAKAEQKAVEREDIAKEINTTIDAAIKAALEAQRARAYEQSAYDSYQRQIKRYEQLRTFREGIAQTVEQMVAALTGTASGAQALQDPRVTPNRILKEWYDTQPPQEQLQKERSVIDFAAFVLAGRTALRRQLAATVWAQEQAVQAALSGLSAESERIAGLLQRKKNAPSVRAMLRREAGAFTAYGKALAVARDRVSKINRKLREIEDYEAAISFHEQLEALPEYRAYYTLLAQYVDEKRHISEYGSDFMIGHKTLVPTPLSGERTEISIKTDKDAMALEQAKAAMVLQELEIWLADPQNWNSIDFGYFKDWAKALEQFISGANYTDFSRTWMGGVTLLNNAVGRATMLIQAILRQYDTIAMTPIMRPMRQWIDSALLMQDWSVQYSHKIVLALESAANSHSEIIKERDQSNRVEQWEKLVGRHLKGQLQAGYEFVVGDPDRGVLLNGIEITQADLDAVKIAADATYAATEQDLVRGRILFENVLVEEQLVRGNEYRRKVIRHSPWELPRVFDPAARLFTKNYIDTAAVRPATATREATDESQIPAKRRNGRELINDNIDLLLTFLWDRRPSFAKNTAISALYPAAIDEFSAGNIKTVQEFEAWLDANAIVDEGEPSGSEQFWMEFDALQEGIHRNAIGEDSSEMVSAKSTNLDKKQENSFTMARGNEIAPYGWYKYGFVSESDLVNFTLNGSSYFMTEVQKGITESIKILKAKRDEFNTQLQKLISGRGGSKPAGTRELQAANKQAIRMGREDVRIQELDAMIHILDSMKTEIAATYLPEGRTTQDELSRIRRIAGLGVGMVLTSIRTALKNLLQTSLFYNGARLNGLGFGITKSFGRAAAQSWTQVGAALIYSPWNIAKSSRHVLKLVPAAAGLTKEGRSAYKQAWKTLRGQHPRGRASGFGEILGKAAVLSIGKAVQEFSLGSLAKMQHYSEMERRGIMLRMNSVEHGLRIAQSLHSSGKLLPSESLDSTVLKLGMGAVGFIDLGITIMSRPMFPRSGDRGGNYSAVATTFAAVKDWQSWLLKRYLEMEDAGVTNRRIDTLEPWHIIPKWFGKSRNYRAMQAIIAWFRAAGMDVKQSINDYFKLLDAASTPAERAAVSWLTQEQTYNLAQAAVEEMNQASPANRSLLAKKNTFMSIAFQLQGWTLNMFSVIMKSIGTPAKKVDNEGKNIRARLFAAQMWFIMIALAAGAASAWEIRWIYRWLAYYLHNGEEQPQRQPWEAPTGTQAVKDTIADAFDAVPYVATFVSMVMRDQGPRRGMSINLWVQNWIMGMINYGAGAWNSGDWRYGLDNLIRRNVPESRIFLNRIPSLEGRYESMNVQSILARNADPELIKTRPSIGGTMSGATATSLTPYTGRMLNAAMTEDYPGLRQIFEEAVDTAMEDRDLDRKEAEQLVRQNYAARSPYNRVFKSKLTAGQRSAMLNRMTPAERQRVLRMEDRLRRGANAIGANITFEEAPRSVSFRSSYGGRRSTARLLRMRTGGGRARILRGRLGRRLTRRLSRI